MKIPTADDIKVKAGPNGTAKRLVQFFEANPDEELTYRDMATKLDIPVTTAYARVHDKGVREAGIEVVTIIRKKRSGA